MDECFLVHECVKSGCVSVCVFSVGSSPSEHSNMTFSTSIKAGSQNPGLLHSLSHTDVPDKDRIVFEHTTPLSLFLSVLPFQSLTWLMSVSQKVHLQTTLTLFFLHIFCIACCLLICSVCIWFNPSPTSCYIALWETKNGSVS